MSQEYQQPQGGTTPMDQQELAAVVAASAAAAVAQVMQPVTAQAVAAQQAPVKAETESSSEPEPIELMELLYHILGRIKYVILAAMLGTILMGCYAFFLSTPVYQATSKLYIMNQDGLSLDMADLNIGSALTMDYQEVFKTWEVHEMVRGMLSLDYSYKEMQDMLTVSNPNDTRLLYITVKHTDPQTATDLANAYATAAKTFIYQTMETAEPNEFSIALVPSTAMGMSKARYLMAGFLAGTVLSLGLLAVQFIADDAPHTPEDITRAAGIPTLAVVPRELNDQKSGKRRRARKEERE